MRKLFIIAALVIICQGVLSKDPACCSVAPEYQCCDKKCTNYDKNMCVTGSVSWNLDNASNKAQKKSKSYSANINFSGKKAVDSIQFPEGSISGIDRPLCEDSPNDKNCVCANPRRIPPACDKPYPAEIYCQACPTCSGCLCEDGTKPPCKKSKKGSADKSIGTKATFVSCDVDPRNPKCICPETGLPGKCNSAKKQQTSQTLPPCSTVPAGSPCNMYEAPIARSNPLTHVCGEVGSTPDNCYCKGTTPENPQYWPCECVGCGGAALTHVCGEAGSTPDNCYCYGTTPENPQYWPCECAGCGGNPLTHVCGEKGSTPDNCYCYGTTPENPQYWPCECEGCGGKPQPLTHVCGEVGSNPDNCYCYGSTPENPQYWPCECEACGGQNPLTHVCGEKGSTPDNCYCFGTTPQNPQYWPCYCEACGGDNPLTHVCGEIGSTPENCYCYGSTPENPQYWPCECEACGGRVPCDQDPTNPECMCYQTGQKGACKKSDFILSNGVVAFCGTSDQCICANSGFRTPCEKPLKPIYCEEDPTNVNCVCRDATATFPCPQSKHNEDLDGALNVLADGLLIYSEHCISTSCASLGRFIKDKNNNLQYTNRINAFLYPNGTFLISETSNIKRKLSYMDVFNADGSVNRKNLFKYIKLWSDHYGKLYTGGQKQLLQATTRILRNIKYMINVSATRRNVTYQLSPNQYLDQTPAEFGKKRDKTMGKKAQEVKNPDVQGSNTNSFYVYAHLNTSEQNIPIDWREQGAISPVKNQGPCGSCWAFTTTAAIEALAYLNGYGRVILSEQQLLDCSSTYGNKACDGGWYDNAFQYIKQVGIVSSQVYPYKAFASTCQLQKGSISLQEWMRIKPQDANQLKAAVRRQPVAVGVNAEGWQFYNGGVFDGASCSSNPDLADHTVLIVGYTNDYWIVKNSWGSQWGEQGYMRLKMGNTCGIMNYPSIPQLHGSANVGAYIGIREGCNSASGCTSSTPCVGICPDSNRNVTFQDSDKKKFLL